MFFSVLFVGDDDYEVEEGAKKSSVVSFCFGFSKSPGLVCNYQIIRFVFLFLRDFVDDDVVGAGGIYVVKSTGVVVVMVTILRRGNKVGSPQCF